MSSGVLFAMGVLVTVLVSVGVALPIYGAILDGRYQAEHEEGELHHLSEKRVRQRPAA